MMKNIELDNGILSVQLKAEGWERSIPETWVYPVRACLYWQGCVQIGGHIVPMQVAWLQLTSWGHSFIHSVSQQVFEVH